MLNAPTTTVEKTADRHTHSSTHREQILEHYFVADVLRHIWQNHRYEDLPEVTYSEVDSGGYDLVIEWRGIQRHIQLKSSISSKSPIRVNSSLSRKRSGCVVLMECNDDLSGVQYLWLGSDPGEPLQLGHYNAAKHTRANSEGVKRESISARKVPRGEFHKVGSIANLVELLFPAKQDTSLPVEVAEIKGA